MLSGNLRYVDKLWLGFFIDTHYPLSSGMAMLIKMFVNHVYMSKGLNTDIGLIQPLTFWDTPDTDQNITYFHDNIIKILCGWDYDDTHCTLDLQGPLPLSLLCECLNRTNTMLSKWRPYRWQKAQKESGTKYLMFRILSGSIANASRWESGTCYLIWKIIRFRDYSKVRVKSAREAKTCACVCVYNMHSRVSL